MDQFFHPRGIALIGASANPKKGGNAILTNLKTGFKGGIYPVNPRYDTIDDIPCYSSVTEVPEPVDLAIIFIPAHVVPDAVAQCGERGIQRVIIESGGFAESGKDGQKLQEAVAEIARHHGIRVWGPNCMGIVDGVQGHVFSFVTPALWDEGLLPGNVSLVVQSGMLAGGFLVDLMGNGIMGVSKVCSVGNKMDVDESDLLEYLIEDGDTGAVGLYLEGIPKGRRFIEICRRSTKPIVVLKGGRSAGGAAAAMSHTASLAGDGAVVSGALAQAGVVQARDFKQMMDICRTLALYPDVAAQPPGRVAVLTFSGGAGIVSADFLDDTGLELAALSRTTLDAMRPVFPAWMPISNPVDLWPAVEKNGVDRTYAMALKAVCSDPGVDAVLIHTFVGGFALKPDIDTLVAISKSAVKPLFIWMLGRPGEARRFRLHTQDLGAPVFGELFRAVECMQMMFKSGNRRALETPSSPVSGSPPDSIPHPLTNLGGVLDEHQAKLLLKNWGVPVVEEEIAESAEAARRISERLKFPVVLKGLVPGELHKTEQGRVRLDITDGKTVIQAFCELTAGMPDSGKILVQRQVSGDLELIAGLVRDPQFGPCVMVGLGGVMAEVLNDAVFAMAPLSRSDALDMIGRLENQVLLDGFRGATPVDRCALADVLVRLGDVADALSTVVEIDVNPLIISGGIPVAVDAAMIIAGKTRRDCGK